jgi:FAD/FMN-containing dehydrogenase
LKVRDNSMSPTSAALIALERELPGRVGEPGSDLYENGRKVFSPVGRIRAPAIVVRPSDRDDVATVLRWASASGIRIAVRSGGHSFDALPIQDGRVLMDLRDLNAVELDAAGRLHAMPGATITEAARALTGAGRMLPLGDCPVVGLGGLVTGGGFGYATRHFGLSLDLLSEVTVATADGALVTASHDAHGDLFWACRGGAGCAGVVTDLVLETVPLDSVTGMTLGWRWEAASEAILLFAEVLRVAPTTLDLKLKIRTTGADRFMDMASAGPADAVPGTPLVHIDGQFLGHRDEARALMRPLLDHAAALPPTIREESYFDAMLQLVPLDLLNDPAPATIRPMRVASDFSRGALGPAEAEAIVAYVDELQTAPDLLGGAVLIEPCNGAVGAVAPNHTAFAHRQADLLYEWELFGTLPMQAAMTSRHDALLSETRRRLSRILTGGRYVNYADMLDTAEDWWGENTAELESIASHYDPGHSLVSRLHP